MTCRHPPAPNFKGNGRPLQTRCLVMGTILELAKMSWRVAAQDCLVKDRPIPAQFTCTAMHSTNGHTNRCTATHCDLEITHVEDTQVLRLRTAPYLLKQSNVAVHNALLQRAKVLPENCFGLAPVQRLMIEAALHGDLPTWYERQHPLLSGKLTIESKSP